MRFLVQPTPAQLARARPPVRIFVLFAALAIAGLAAQRVRAGGLVPAEVEATYLGVAGDEGLPATAVLEELHVNAFVYGFVLFVLASVLAVCPVPARVRNALTGAALAATVADLLAPYAILAAGGGGVLRVATFAFAVASLAALAAAVTLGLGRGGRRADA
jgi:hypothetical protein